MDMLWNGWGDPAKAAPLPDSVTGLLRDLLGVKPRSVPALALEDIEPPAPTAGPAALAALAEAVGDAAHVRTDPQSRIRHTRGKSTPDLLRIRVGDTSDVPQAVVLPATHEEVLAVLRACAAHGLAAVPFGGGTSVVGGLAPERGAFVALDLRRMNRLLDLDTVSRTAVLQPGLRAPEAEALLAEQGFTLGHFPQSFEWASIGGFAAARSSGQASAGYGRFDEMVLDLTLATPEGTVETGRRPPGPPTPATSLPPSTRPPGRSRPSPGQRADVSGRTTKEWPDPHGHPVPLRPGPAATARPILPRCRGGPAPDPERSVAHDLLRTARMRRAHHGHRLLRHLRAPAH